MHKFALILLTALVLTGCATLDWSNASPEQRQMAFQMMQQNQQTYHSSFVPIQPYQMQTAVQTHCTSSMIGGYVNTNCSSY